MLEEFKKCLHLIDPGTTWQAVGIAVLVLITALLEALGIGVIFAFVQALIGPSQLDQMAWLTKLVGPAVANDKVGFLIFLAITLLCIFILKNILLLGFFYLQSRFVAINGALLSARLFDSYLNGAYAFHLNRNSAELIRTVIGSATSVFSGAIMGFITFGAEIVMIIALATVLVVIEPMLSLGAAFVLGGAVAIFYTFSKHHFVALGAQEQKVTAELLQSLQQGLHSIKEVKVLGRQSSILEGFVKHRLDLARISTNTATLSLAPRLWVESIIIGAVLSVVIVALFKSGDSEHILSALTLFAAAAFRMIPSMNRILVSLGIIKGASTAVDLVYQDCLDFGGNPDEGSGDDGATLPYSASLSVEKLVFKYAEGDEPVLKDVDFVLAKGESLGLVGPSGSGKSTLVDIMLGLLVPTSGRIMIDGVDIFHSLRAWRRQIGYVPQSIYIIDDTLRRNVAFAMDNNEIDELKVKNAIKMAQLDELVAELPEGLDTNLGERGVRLSGGQRQRVGIARALYRDPEVLILDEATSSLDAETEHEINNAIERLTGEKTLIIIAHRLSTVRKCTRLAYIRDGHLIDTGSFNELKDRNADFNNLIELSQL
jgi:ATP-binding cassette, subfamily B, bacterial PglK